MTLNATRTAPARTQPASPSETTYDRYAEYYTDLVAQMLADPAGFWLATRGVFDRRLGPLLRGRAVLDVCCGEGHLGRHLTQYGPAQITGVDVSQKLLERARSSGEAYGGQLRYQLDDAQRLVTVGAGSIDVAVSHLAIMDVPDHRALFRAVRRALRPGGVFVFSLMHPCFEAPFGPEGQFLHDPGRPGQRAAYAIRRYTTEGLWFAGQEGMRSRVGAHHRTMSTLMRDLISAGLTLTHLEEPVTPTDDLGGEIPRTLVIEVRA